MGRVPEIRLDDSVAGRLVLAWVVVDGVQVRERDAALEAEMAAFAQRLREELQDANLLRERLGPARRLYRTFGIEPTKRRPSSEALIRRVLKGKGLYRINTVVDVCNWCSMEFALPIGLYDAAKIQGNVLCRVGGPNEGYAGIRKDWVNVSGRVALVDDLGPFGNPSSDSFRTSVDLSTRTILFVVFAPADHGVAQLEADLGRAATRLMRFNGGEVLTRQVVAGSSAH